MTRNQRSGLIVLSILVAALAMGLWIRNFGVSTAELSQLWNGLRLWPILPLFGLLIGHVALSAWRWSLIEVGLGGDRPRFSHAFATGAFALGLGTFLPAPMVNVACRGLANRVNGSSGMRGALSGGIDQMADLSIILLLVIPAAFALAYHDIGIYVFGAFATLSLGFALTLTLPEIFKSGLVPARITWLAFVAKLADRRLLMKLYGISLLRAANLTLMTLAIHSIIGSVTVTAVIIAVPLVTLAISVAMLPGAFGVSEWSFSAVFASFRIAPDDIVLFVLANRIILSGLSIALALLILLAMALKLFARDKVN